MEIVKKGICDRRRRNIGEDHSLSNGKGKEHIIIIINNNKDRLKGITKGTSFSSFIHPHHTPKNAPMHKLTTNFIRNLCRI